VNTAVFKEVAVLVADLEVTPALLEVIVAITEVFAGTPATVTRPVALIDAVPTVVVTAQV
jgi:hypothetical protein